MFWEAPPLWAGETIVLIATGPSVTADQVEYCRESARMIAINDAYRIAPRADILYACDARWWLWHKSVPDFLGVRVGLSWDNVSRTQYPQWDQVDTTNINLMYSTGRDGLETKDRHGLRTGHNSGYQAINLAVHLGASRIILIGYDMKAKDGRHHFFGNHPGHVPSPPYRLMKKAFKTLVQPLQDLGIEIYNCTRDSALKAFPCARLESVV